MKIREIECQSAIAKCGFPGGGLAINPYVGCSHTCTYCYARFMKRFTGHLEPWGSFVDVKVNAVELLRGSVARAKPGRVWISGVCDPYQPVEKKYRLTRGCLEVLLRHGWPVTVQTKSPLVLRDLDLLQGKKDVEVGTSIATADDRLRKIFEPGAPPIVERIKALGVLHEAGVKTFAMIAPLLPGAEALPALLAGKVDRITVDMVNYHYADWVYRKYRLEEAMTEDFFASKSTEIAGSCRGLGIECRVI